MSEAQTNGPRGPASAEAFHDDSGATKPEGVPKESVAEVSGLGEEFRETPTVETYLVEKKPNAGFEISPAAADDNSPEPNRAGRHRREWREKGYEILGEIGHGGAGVVHRARQVLLDRECALKTLKSGDQASSPLIDRFIQEAGMIAKLDHPNIVRIHHIGDNLGLPFIELEYLEGGNLGERIARLSMSPRESAEIVETVARAVHEAHLAGIVHRDLKPANVLLTASGIPKVADFGLAKLLGDDPGMTMSGAVIGTPSYMAPEQAAGRLKEIGPLSDVYALGAILYETLTQRPPFRGGTIQETLDQVRSDTAVSISRLRPLTPPDLETICVKCLEKEPLKRYDSAKALADDLHRFLEGVPILARRATPAERAWRWCRRNPVIAGLTAGLFLVMATATVVSARLTVLARIGEQKADESAAQARLFSELAERGRAEAERHARRAEANLYAAEIVLANQAWRAGAIGEVRTRLERTAPGREIRDDIRGFEWGLLDRLTKLELRSLAGHERPISDLAFSQDGARIASSSLDGTVRIWDVGEGLLLRKLNVAPRAARVVAYRPGGRQVACGAAQGRLSIWDVETGEQVWRIHAHDNEINDISYSSDGRRLATAGKDSRIKIWNADTGKMILDFREHPAPVLCLAFSPDSSMIASADEDYKLHPAEAILWNAETGRIVKRLKGHSDTIHSICFEPSGKRVVTGGDDFLVKMWDVGSGRVLQTYRGHHGAVLKVGFDGSGRRIVSTGVDQTVRIWSSEEDKELLSLRGHAGQLNSAVFSPDGRLVASAGGDRVLKLWNPGGKLESQSANASDAMNGPETKTLVGHDDEVYSVAYDPRGRGLASTGKDGTVRVWNVETRREAWSGDDGGGPQYATAYSPDGRRVVSAASDGVVRVWNADDGRLLGRLEPGVTPAMCLSFSPNGNVAVGYGGGQIRIWDPETRRLIAQYEVHNGEVRGLAFSPDGRRLASGGEDKTLRIRDLENPTAPVRAYEPVGGVIRCVAFAPDGRKVAAAGIDRTIRLYDVTAPSNDSGARDPELLEGHALYVYALAFSPDGRRLFSAGHDKTVRIWDLDRKQEIMKLPGLDYYVQGLAVRPDGKALAAASWDWTVRVWEAEPESVEAKSARELTNYLSYLLEANLEAPATEKLLREDRSISEELRVRAAKALATATGARDRIRSERRDRAVAYRDFIISEKDPTKAILQDFAAVEKSITELEDEVKIDTLGMLRYRLGKYQSALDAFGQARRLRGGGESRSRLIVEGFRAMTLFRLGEEDQARELLKRLSEVSAARANISGQALSVLQEARAMIEGNEE